MVFGIGVIVMSCKAELEEVGRECGKWSGRCSRSFVHALRIHGACQDSESPPRCSAFILPMYSLEITASVSFHLT